MPAPESIAIAAGLIRSGGQAAILRGRERRMDSMAPGFRWQTVTADAADDLDLNAAVDVEFGRTEASVGCHDLTVAGRTSRVGGVWRRRGQAVTTTTRRLRTVDPGPEGGRDRAAPERRPMAVDRTGANHICGPGTIGRRHGTEFEFGGPAVDVTRSLRCVGNTVTVLADDLPALDRGGKVGAMGPDAGGRRVQATVQGARRGRAVGISVAGRTRQGWHHEGVGGRRRIGLRPRHESVDDEGEIGCKRSGVGRRTTVGPCIERRGRAVWGRPGV